MAHKEHKIIINLIIKGLNTFNGVLKTWYKPLLTNSRMVLF